MMLKENYSCYCPVSIALKRFKFFMKGGVTSLIVNVLYIVNKGDLDRIS